MPKMIIGTPLKRNGTAYEPGMEYDPEKDGMAAEEVARLLATGTLIDPPKPTKPAPEPKPKPEPEEPAAEPKATGRRGGK